MAALKSVRIDFTGARSKAAMLEIVATSLKFPRHFGMNLDALFDCLTDLAAGPAGATVTLVKLARTPAGESVHAVFMDAARFWKKQRSGITLVRE